jgi:hypothetical protein
MNSRNQYQRTEEQGKKIAADKKNTTLLNKLNEQSHLLTKDTEDNKCK